MDYQHRDIAQHVIVFQVSTTQFSNHRAQLRSSAFSTMVMPLASLTPSQHDHIYSSFSEFSETFPFHPLKLLSRFHTTTFRRCISWFRSGGQISKKKMYPSNATENNDALLSHRLAHHSSGRGEALNRTRTRTHCIDPQTLCSAILGFTPSAHTVIRERERGEKRLA